MIAKSEPGLQRLLELIEPWLDKYLHETDTPGLVIGITDRRRVLGILSFGLSEIQGRTPMRIDSIFQIGSITKSFTAIALLQLSEEGRFDPEAPITNYLPWLRINSHYAPITGRHLLSHTAGLPRDRDDIPSSPYQAGALEERNAGFAPGARFYYSNIGYQVLGRVLEQIERQPYGTIIQRRIFQPLGMGSSEAVITHKLRERLAVGYTRLYDDRPSHPSHPLVPATWIEYDAGDGAICSTASDLTSYVRMLLNKGQGRRGRILSEESFRLMTSHAIETEQKGLYYGYGLFSWEDDGKVFFAHGGGMPGYVSRIVADMDAGIGVVVLANMGVDPGDVIRQVGKFVLDSAGAFLRKGELPRERLTVNLLKVPNGTDYEGNYSSLTGKTIRVVAESDRLKLVYKGEEIALEPRGRELFLANHSDFDLFAIRFLREGDVVVEVIHGADWYRSDRYTGPQTFDQPEEWLAYPGHYRAQHPFFPNFRIVLLKGKLWFAPPGGGEQPLDYVKPGMFRIVDEGRANEELTFDKLVEGKAMRVNLSGCDYYRTFTP